MSKEHDAPALARREPTISDPDRDAISTAARAELRDRFAMAALTGFLANSSLDHLDLDEEEWAKDAYRLADAMMRARGHE